MSSSSWVFVVVVVVCLFACLFLDYVQILQLLFVEGSFPQDLTQPLLEVHRLLYLFPPYFPLFLKHMILSLLVCFLQYLDYLFLFSTFILVLSNMVLSFDLLVIFY